MTEITWQKTSRKILTTWHQGGGVQSQNAIYPIGQQKIFQINSRFVGEKFEKKIMRWRRRWWNQLMFYIINVFMRTIIYWRYIFMRSHYFVEARLKFKYYCDAIEWRIKTVLWKPLKRLSPFRWGTTFNLLRPPCTPYCELVQLAVINLFQSITVGSFKWGRLSFSIEQIARQGF